MIITFSEYLTRIGFFEKKTPEEWTFIREQYRKFYMREYQKERKKLIKRIETQMSLSEHEIIKKAADIYGDKPATFMRKATLSFSKSKIYLPAFSDLEETKYLIRKSSNNINQLVYGCHRNKTIYQEDIKALVAQCNLMENTLDNFYQTPKVIFTPLNLIK